MAAVLDRRSGGDGPWYTGGRTTSCRINTMSHMPFSRFEITRYRGLRGLVLEGLGRINLLVGTNNSGKTSVLEALSLCAAPMDPWTWIDAARRRDPSSRSRHNHVERLRWLFPQAVSTEPDELFKGALVLAAKGGGLVDDLRATYHELRGTPLAQPTEDEDEYAGGHQLQIAGLSTSEEMHADSARHGARIDISVTPAGPFFDSPQKSFTFWEGERFVSKGRSGPSLLTAFVTPYDHWLGTLPAFGFSEAKRGGLEAAVVELLRQLDSRITDVEVLASRPSPRGLGGEAVLYLRDKTAGLLPIDAFGDGFRRVLLMALAIPRAAGGVLFIDEIETAIHVSALATVFRWMVAACHQHNVQLFVTTHSLEALDAILAADPTPEEDIIAYKLEPTAETTNVRRYGEDLLKRLRFTRGLEVR
jgi:hypothetical protein